MYKILDRSNIKPFRIRYYCERHDPDFEQKMHNVLLVYKQLSLQFDQNGELLPFEDGGRFEFVFTPRHASWLNLVEGFFSKMTKQMLKEIRVDTKDELVTRIYKYFGVATAIDNNAVDGQLDKEIKSGAFVQIKNRSLCSRSMLLLTKFC